MYDFCFRNGSHPRSVYTSFKHSLLTHIDNTLLSYISQIYNLSKHQFQIVQYNNYIDNHIDLRIDKAWDSDNCKFSNTLIMFCTVSKIHKSTLIHIRFKIILCKYKYTNFTNN